MSDIYHNPGKTIYLMLLFHQHQPFYLDRDMKSLIAPWVRTHTTKDYLYVPNILKKYPNVHLTVNLTPSLLLQIQEHYVKNLKKFVDVKKINLKRIRKFPEVERLLDLLIKPTKYFTKEDILSLYTYHYSTLSVNEVLRHYFPEYEKLYKIFSEAREKNILINNLQLLRELKFWFTLLNFNLDIIEGPIKLTDNSIVDLSDFLFKKTDGKYYLRRKITEHDCEKLFVASYCMMINFVPVHKQIIYNPHNNIGQIELSTSPYSHPILPLIYDTESAKECMDSYILPNRFHYPEDARLQVKMGLEIFEKYFGYKPTGMWPSEGAISRSVAKIFIENNLQWFATDMQILYQSVGRKISHLTPYNLNIDNQNIVAFFRDTVLSDKIGFRYQNFDGEESADDFIKHILSYSDRNEEKVVSVILDGENAWEWYRKDPGAREFLNALFRKLEKLYRTKAIVTITPYEYINGNISRGILPHPKEKLPVLKHISSGSWIHGNFGKWIGSMEKNYVWDILLEARMNLEKTGYTFEHLRTLKRKSKREKYLFKAYECMFIAEGSDWFWWAGEDQESYTGEPFNELFFNYINQVYVNLLKAGYKVKAPKIISFEKLKKEEKFSVSKIGSMKMGQKTLTIKFICDSNGINVPDAIYIAGNLEELGEWVPNLVRMNKITAKGKLYSTLWEYEIKVPEGTVIHYKYTNSGKRGEWSGSEEFPALNRTVIAQTKAGENLIILKDKFGKL